jgi:hypothetical protein
MTNNAHPDIMLNDLRPATGGACTSYAWQLQTRAGFGLQFAHVGDAEPPARLACPARGWHRVFLGFQGPCSLRLRLAGGDPWFRRVETSVLWGTDSSSGEELYWCDADLTDAIFEFLPQPLLNRADRRQSRLAYLRLQPLSGGRPPSLHTATTRSAGAVIDGHELLGAYAPTTPDAVRGMIAPFVDSDFRRLHFGCSCTTMRLVYLTQVGHWLGQDQPLESLHSDHNRRCAQALQAAADDGWDPVDVMIEFTRTHDMELWADFRIQQDYAFDYIGGFGYDFNSPFTEAHQDWRHVDRSGAVCSHSFSHFHSGWEQYKLDLLAELARKGPAGLHVNFTCELGALWDFAPEAVARYRDETGEDPLVEGDLPESWYQFRADHLTRFMQRLRTQTEAIADELGRPIPIAVQVSGEWSILKARGLVKAVSQNWLSGFDVGRWAREGLIDVISPSFRRTYKPMFLEHLYDELGSARAHVQIVPSVGQHDNAVFPRGYEWNRYFTDAGVDPTGDDLVPFGELDAWRVLREAHDLYRQGADAVDVWEMGAAPTRLARWDVLRRLGDREWLAQQFGTRVGGLLGTPERPLSFS